MSLKNQAIQTALMGDWKTAVSLNLELLKENPEDIETLNRLAFAYTVLGKLKEAKNTYQTVLKLDDKNPIALKNLRRLTETDKKQNLLKIPSFIGQINTMFLEESGKTKIIELLNVAEQKTISRLMTGELLVLGIKRLKIFAFDEKKQFIGMLPDDIGKRLIKFIKGGNCYQAFVKSVEPHGVIIFIKEISRATRFKNQPSFTLGERGKNELSNKVYVFKNQDDGESEDSSAE